MGNAIVCLLVAPILVLTTFAVLIAPSIEDDQL